MESREETAPRPTAAFFGRTRSSHIPGQEELDCRGSSYINRHEALKVQDLVILLPKDSRDLGVITFYSTQKGLLMKNFPSSGLVPEVASVDGFQGREKDFIVLSTVRADAIGSYRNSDVLISPLLVSSTASSFVVMSALCSLPRTKLGVLSFLSC